MSTRARDFGNAGTIVYGGFHNLVEQRALDYPDFARDIGTAPPYDGSKSGCRECIRQAAFKGTCSFAEGEGRTGGNLEGNDLQASELIVSKIQYVAINNENAGHCFHDAI
jgi:hypothetical protein